MFDEQMLFERGQDRLTKQQLLLNGILSLSGRFDDLLWIEIIEESFHRIGNILVGQSLLNVNKWNMMNDGRWKIEGIRVFSSV